MKKILLAAAAAIAFWGPAHADYNITTPLIAPPGTTLRVVKSGTDSSGSLLNYSAPIDTNGLPFGTLSNPFSFQFGSGVTLPPFASPPSVSITGTLPNFASVQHFICDSGCSGGGGGGGTSSNFGSQFPTVGTAIGVASGSNMVALAIGQQLAASSLPVVLTAAQLATLTPPTSVGITGSVAVTGTFWQATQPVSLASTTITGSVAVTGTFFQATQPISAVSLPLPTGAATQTTLAGVLTALGSPFQAGGSIGNTTFASTQSGTWSVTNISGTVSLPTGASTSALQTTGNTSLASILTALGSPFQAAGTLGAGSAIIGKVGIDQTTPATTNGVALVPNSATAGAIAPVPSTSAESSHVFKAGAGNVYSTAATNQSSTAGYYMLIDATTAPADGAVTPKACAPLPASGSASINYGDIPGGFTTGIVGVVSSGGNCFTKTTGVITAFLSGQVK